MSREGLRRTLPDYGPSVTALLVISLASIVALAVMVNLSDRLGPPSGRA